MKRRALLKLVLALTFVFGAWAPLADAFEISATALADSATPITRKSDRAGRAGPMTDRLPWLIYVVLTIQPWRWVGSYSAWHATHESTRDRRTRLTGNQWLTIKS